MTPLDPIRRGYADTPRGQLHYCEAGRGGEVMLLLHAMSRSSRCYRRMLPILGEHMRAVALDLPGFGASHSLDAVHSVVDLAACVVDFLDAMQFDRVHVFGLHLGNKVGSALAAKWPERVSSIVLAGQTHSLIVDRARRDEEIGRLSRHHYPPAGHADNGLSLLQAWSAVNATAQAQWWTPALLKRDEVSAEDVEDARSRLIDYLTGQPSLAQLYPKVHAHDMTDACRRIRARALVLEFLTPEEMHLGRQAPEMARLMPCADHASLEDADNMALEARAPDVCAIVLRFLQARVGQGA